MVALLFKLIAYFKSFNPFLFIILQAHNLSPSIISLFFPTPIKVNLLSTPSTNLLLEPIFVILTSFSIFKFKYSCFIHVLIIIQICLAMTNPLPLQPQGQPHLKIGPCHYCVKTNQQLFTVRERELYKGRSSEERKQRLIELVTTENYRIKEAAKIVGITYSTAKKIFIKFRKTLKAAHIAKFSLNLSNKRAEYAEIPIQEMPTGNKMALFSTIAGKSQQKTEQQFDDSECEC